MSPSRARYITLCQQFLALGVVLAALAPAAAVVSLDVIRESPAAGPSMPRGPLGPLGGTGLPGADDPSGVPGPGEVAATAERRSRALAATRSAAGTGQAAVVPTAPVDPKVTEVPLGGTRAATVRERRTSGSDEVVSTPQPVTGFGTVGVTWASGTTIPEGGLDLRLRTRTDGTWSAWQTLDYHDDHGADPGSAEAAHERPGTDEALVGHVDDVQVKVATTDGDALPKGLSLAVIDPGTPAKTAIEGPALEGGASRSAGSGEPANAGAGEGIALRAARTGTGQPTIYSRAQWGADERIREQSAPQYGTIQGGFVHHTVNANDYTADEVPGIIRSIYAYHVKSRGWRDIGYNFLVDRFGRIWEGRYGGIDRPVVGAHTSGYNDVAFAMSAIGNFDLVQPSPEIVQSFAQLFAWKLAISGVSAAATNVKIGKSVFASSIMGHRDAGQTACPGQYLYAQIPTIRSLATQAQAGMVIGPAWTGRDVGSDLVGTAYPDLVLRRAADGRGVILPTDGLTRFASAAKVSSGWKSVKKVLLTPDVTGDGRTDLIVVGRSGTPRLRAGKGGGTFAKTVNLSKALRGYSQLTAVGDLDRDGRNDLVGRTSKGALELFRGKGRRTFAPVAAKGSWKGFDLLVGPGDVTGDGRADLMARDKKGRMWLFKGSKKGLGKRVKVAGSWGRYDAVVGGGDYNGDTRPDLVVRRAKTGDVFLLPGLGGPSFGAPLGPITNLKKVSLLSGAVLGADGRADLLGRSGNKLVRFDNLGTSEVAAPVETNLDLSGATRVVNAGDFDRDGVADVIVRDAAGALTLRPGAGGGVFGAPVPIGTGFGAVEGLTVVADRTGDGSADLVGQVAGVWTLWSGHGRGAVALAQSGTAYGLAPGGADLSAYSWVVPISDGDGDGVSDLLARTPAGDLYLLPGGPKALGTPRLVTGGLQGYDLAG